MKKEWIKIIPQIANCLDGVEQLKCPDCGKHEIDYIYVGDKETRVGFLQIWCNQCFKGIYISRVVAPVQAKFVSFEADLEGIVPQYDYVNVL